MKGGYVELNCGGVKLSTTSVQNIAGIWDKAVIATKYGKPLCLTNLYHSADKPITNAFSKAYYGSASAIVVMLDKYTITIANNDNVTVVNDINAAVNAANSVISMTGVNLNVSTAQSVSGIFSKVKAAIEGTKPIILTGIIYNTGKPCSPITAYGYMESDSSALICFDQYELTVSTANTVTVENWTA